MHYTSIFEYREALDFLLWLQREHGIDPKALRSASAILNQDFVTKCAGGYACGSKQIIEEYAKTLAGSAFAERIAKKTLQRLRGK